MTRVAGLLWELSTGDTEEAEAEVPAMAIPCCVIVVAISVISSPSLCCGGINKKSHPKKSKKKKVRKKKLLCTCWMIVSAFKSEWSILTLLLRAE